MVTSTRFYVELKLKGVKLPSTGLELATYLATTTTTTTTTTPTLPVLCCHRRTCFTKITPPLAILTSLTSRS
ncbi:hypothetical protein E2C01_101539 [Portunus trituberculatus]|uniref:Uncharacterized protein n=1 Tax=Portunus trituberculatus TaxID=210409 RepID=A0A5B7KFZ8_PORTR|nr:hypothetical protein [Portunus trituberculatus]